MNFSKKTILVTGASGFVGRALCHSLLQKGYKIRAVVRTPEKANQLKQNNSNFSDLLNCQIETDLIKATNYPAFFEDIEIIIHLAARAHVMEESIQNPIMEYRNVNVKITRHLAEKAAQHGVKRFIYLSSIKVYGEISPMNGSEIKKFTEQDTPKPEDAYAISKWEAENALQKIAQKTALEVVVLRAPVIYGKGVGANFEKLIHYVKRKFPLPLASIKNLRSLIYIENLCDIITLCIHHREANNQVFLVSDGAPVSTPELIKALSIALKTPARLYRFPLKGLRFLGWITRKKMAVSRLTNSLIVDDSKCRELLNWKPPHLMAEALSNDFGEPKK
jgi:nucleoside-diphosphate-sugar epimerase